MLTVGRPSWRMLASFILFEPFYTNFLDYRANPAPMWRNWFGQVK